MEPARLCKLGEGLVMGMPTEGGVHPFPCPPGSSAGEDAVYPPSRLAPAQGAECREHSLGDTPPLGRPCPTMLR